MSTGLLGLPWKPVCCLLRHHRFSLSSSVGVKASWSLPINTSDASAQNVEPPTGTVIGGVQASLGKDNQTVYFPVSTTCYGCPEGTEPV